MCNVFTNGILNGQKLLIIMKFSSCSFSFKGSLPFPAPFLSLTPPLPVAQTSMKFVIQLSSDLGYSCSASREPGLQARASI